MNTSRHKTSLTVLTSVAGTLLLLGVTGIAVIYSGTYNVGATDEHSGVVRWALHTMAERSMKAHAKDIGELQLPTGEEALRRGFAGFDEMCTPCHGAPGVERSWLGQGIRPQGPDLTRSAQELGPAELHWAIEHGFKFTGMPGLAPTHSAEEILELTAFVVRLKDLTEEDYLRLRAERAKKNDQPVPSQETHGQEKPEPAEEKAPDAGSGHDHPHSHSH